MDIKNCVMTDQYKRIQGAKLKVQNKTFSVYKGVNTIGRNKTAIINLKNLNVSQHHAVIVIVDDTQHFISDLNSSNGTYLYNAKLVPFKLYELSNEVEIKFGDVLASYIKMANQNTTLHLQTENMEMTQNFTQNFYAATTQLMFEDLSVNQKRLSSLPQEKVLIRDTQDIHEIATQVEVYPSTIIDKDDDTDVVVEMITDDIHDAPTQIVLFHPQASTSKASQENVLDGTTDNINEKNGDGNIHEMITQVVLRPPEGFDTVKDLREIKEKVDAPSKMNEIIHECAVQIVNSEASSSKGLNEAEALFNANSQVGEESFINLQKHTNCSIIQESVIEESVLEEKEENLKKNQNEAITNEDSNESMDFLTQVIQFNENTNGTDDNTSALSDSDIGRPNKRISRKLSSSEDTLQTQNNKKTCNSDSETDIEDMNDFKNTNNQEMDKLTTKNSKLALTYNKTCSSDSETDIEDDLPRINKKRIKAIPSDSETDVEDAVLDDVNLTQSEDIIKPKMLSKKLHFKSDSEIDVEDNKEKESALEAAGQEGDSSTIENLNDTDCIPPTQDAFAEMFQYKSSKLPNSNPNSQNISSEESFKLGLTELMIDGEENSSISERPKNENEKVDQISDKPGIPKTTETIVKEVGESNMISGEMINEKINCEDGKKDSVKTVNNNVEDIFTMETQNTTEDREKLEAPKLPVKNKNELNNIPSTSKGIDEDLYMMSTQKINEHDEDKSKLVTDTFSKQKNDFDSIPSTSKVNNIEKEADEDLYMMPTQKIKEHNHEFKTPIKKFNFKKKLVNLEGSLTTILSSNEEEDCYLLATQKINEDTNKDDIYMQPTQNLNPIHENALELNEDKIDEEFYMAPTQQMNKESVNEHDLFMCETEKFDNQSCKEQSEKDLYDLPTQSIVIVEADEIPLNNKASNTSVHDRNVEMNVKHLVGTNQDTPRRKRLKKSDIENLKKTIESTEHKDDVETLSQIDACIKMPLNRHHSETDDDKVETLSQIEAFVKQPLENLSKCGERSNSKIVKGDSQMTGFDEIELGASIEKLADNVNILSSEVKQLENKENKYFNRKEEEEEIARPETLSQIEAFIKNPIDVELSKFGNSKEDETGKKKKTDVNEFEKPKRSARISRAKECAKSIDDSTSKSSSKTTPSNSELYMLETQKFETQSGLNTDKLASNQVEIDLFDIPTQQLSSQGHKRLSPIVLVDEDSDKTNSTAKYLEDTNSDVPMKKRLKKSDIDNLEKITHPRDKVADTEEVDRPETLSQIEAFIKIPVEVSKSTKFPGTEERASTSGSEKNNEMKGTNVKNAVEFEKPKRTTRVSRAKLSTKLFDEENKEKDKMPLIPESTPQMPNEELEKKNVSTDKNVSSSSTDTIRSDIDQSFALLEAKSTKTRRSNRVTNVSEIKVAAHKNRRSMMTSSIPECSKNVIKTKPSTRTSRKVTADENIVVAVPDEKSNRIPVKRKTDTSDSDFSEAEVPTKVSKLSVRNKGKGKAVVKGNVDKITIVSEETTTGKDISAANKKNRIKDPVTPSVANVKASSKVISSKNSEDNSYGSESSSVAEDNIVEVDVASKSSKRGIEPATPSTSKARVSSRITSSKKNQASASCESDSTRSREMSVPTPSRRGRRTMLDDALLTSAERSKRKQRPKVVFTMLDNPQLESLIRQLGGSVVDTVDASNILVTEYVKRSQKLLTAVGQGKPICSPDWIRASKKANEFLDPWDYILTDKEAETKWNFSLQESLSKARNEKLLVNYSFQLLISNAVDVLKGAIEACGGKCITRSPPKNADGFYVVVASPDNKSKYLKIKKQNPEAIVVEPEAIFDGVLRQDLRLGRHLLT